MKRKASPSDDLHDTEHSRWVLAKPSALRILIVISLILIIYLQFVLWIGDGSISEILRLHQSIERIQKENAQLKLRNQALYEEIEALRSGLDLIEHRARKDLGFIKKDEVFYHLIDDRSLPSDKKSTQDAPLNEENDED